MRASNLLVGLGVAALVTVIASGASATPLQSRLEILQLSGAGIELGAPAPGSVVESVVDLSSDGGLAGPRSIAPPLLEGQGLFRTPNSSGSFPVQPNLDLQGTSGAAAPDPSVEIFRDIVSEAAGSRPAPGVEPEIDTVGRDGSMQSRRRQTDNPNDEKQVTLKDLIRILINQQENLSLEAPVVAPLTNVTGPAEPEGDSILNAILSVTVDKEIVQAISTVLRPSIDVKGVVALNVFGLREIALLVTPSSNTVRLVDLGTGRSMSFRVQDRGDTPLARRRPGAAHQDDAHQVKSERENLLPTVMAAVRNWIATYVFNGVTLVSLMALSIFWIVWRFARGESE